MTPLHAAASCSETDAVKLLLEKGAALECRDTVSCILNDTHIITT